MKSARNPSQWSGCASLKPALSTSLCGWGPALEQVPRHQEHGCSEATSVAGSSGNRVSETTSCWEAELLIQRGWGHSEQAWRCPDQSGACQYLPGGGTSGMMDSGSPQGHVHSRESFKVCLFIFVTIYITPTEQPPLHSNSQPLVLQK